MTLTLRLTCLVLSDADDNPNEHIARVEIHDNDIVADLRKLIKQEYAHRLHNFDASDIVLWRCSIPADDNLHETLKTIHFDVSDTRLDRLSPSSLVSKHFTTGLSPETIHILVKVPTLGEYHLSGFQWSFIVTDSLGMTQSPSWDINFGTRPGFNGKSSTNDYRSLQFT
jgi:hypothetical protein